MSTRVLLVDDSSMFRHAARELLEARGYAVVAEASDTASAVDALQQHRPDAALIDLWLPEGSGCDLCALLTRTDPGLAVLLASADRNPPSPDALEASGARGFVFKSQLVATDLTRFWPLRS